MLWWWIGRWLWLLNGRLLWRLRRRWVLLRGGLRGGTSLMRRRHRLRLRGDTLGIMYILRLRSRTLLWSLLAWLRRLLLHLLGLMCLLSLLGLLGLLNLLSLLSLHSQEMLLLLYILRLSMRHLLQLHLGDDRTHPRILHGCQLSGIQCLRTIRH